MWSEMSMFQGQSILGVLEMKPEATQGLLDCTRVVFHTGDPWGEQLKRKGEEWGLIRVKYIYFHVE